MTPNDLSDLGAATHVVFDPFMPERLTKLGASNVVCALDCLIIGPSRKDTQEHARLRAAWWDSSDPWDKLYSANIRWTPPAIVWVSTSPKERLNLFRTCSRLYDLGISHRDIIMVELESAPSGNPDYDRLGCSESASDHGDEVLLARLAEARPWPRTRHLRAGDLWRRYVDPDISGFARTCLRGLAGFPELSTVWFLVSSFFPRQTSKGTLHLSRFDELLLDRLSTDWKTPVDVYVRGSEEWEQLVCCTGDLFVPRRLEHWTHHSGVLAIERAPGPKPGSPMRSFVYRLTERGVQLRAGLSQLANAPPLPMAGTEAYAPESPWVLRDDGKLMRL